MKNIDKTIVERIGEKSAEMYSKFSDADGWIRQNLKFEDKELLSVQVKKSKSEVSKINEYIDSKPVFALFGISQVGKSYLVQNLLNDGSKPLEVIAGDNRIDFLRKINPQGSGAESTGVVTRFSIDDFSLSKEYPIKAKILTPKDLILILSDSFFSDVSRLENYFSREDFVARVNELKDEFSGGQSIQKNLSEDDIWDISKYFKQNFDKFSHYVNVIESSKFWSEVGDLICKVPSNKWWRLFEVIWYDTPEITKLFKELVSTLEMIGFSKTIYVSEDTILRDAGAILDVQRLNDMLDSSPLVTIMLDQKETCTVAVSKLSALISELSLQVDPNLADKKTFLKNTDLLDFPGARSRESFTLENINDDSIVKMYLRGKISYLFNKYSGDFEINNLLFCMKDEKIEVNELAGILNNWIEKNIGFDADAREKRIGDLPTSPLFVILTFFNRQLEFDPVNDDKIEGVKNKWDNRFRRFFEEQITFKYGWHTHWTKSNPSFSNFYLLRDFQFSKDMFNSEAGKEIEVKPDRIDHWNNLKQTFLDYPFVKKHFPDPEKTWEMSASPNKDGSQMIIDALAPAANNYVKVKNFSDRLEDMKSDLLLELNKHFVSDDLHEKRIQAFKKANDIHFGLMNLFNSSGFRFSDFLNTFSLSATEVYNLIHENFLQASRRNEPQQYSLLRATFPDLSSELSRNENLQIIADQLKFSGPAEAEDYLDERNIDLNSALENRVYTSATILVDGVIDLWESKMTIENFDEFIKIGLSKSTLLDIKDGLLHTFKTLHVRSELIDIFEQKTKLIYSPSETEEYLSSVSSAYINDFVGSFGFNFMSNDRLSELFDLCEEFGEDPNLLKSSGSKVEEKDLIKIYDTIDSLDSVQSPLLENFMVYSLKMKMAFISNCGFANYNVEANKELKSIIEGLETLDFSVNK